MTKAYAIKTSKGYLATQGNTQWFEEAPVGWALFATYEHATSIMESYPEEKGEVVEVIA